MVESPIMFNAALPFFPEEDRDQSRARSRQIDERGTKDAVETDVWRMSKGSVAVDIKSDCLVRHSGRCLQEFHDSASKLKSISVQVVIANLQFISFDVGIPLIPKAQPGKGRPTVRPEQMQETMLLVQQ